MLNSAIALYTGFLFQCRTWRLIDEGFLLFLLYFFAGELLSFVLFRRWYEVVNDFESVLITELIRLHRQTLHLASTVEIPAGCGYEMAVVEITGESFVYCRRGEGAKEGWGTLICLSVDKVVGPGDMDHDWGVSESECLH